MKFVHKLCYIALGGFLFALGTIISPIIAEKTKFGEIECTKLTVVNQDGDPVVVLSADDKWRGGVINVHGASGGLGGALIGVHPGQEEDLSVLIQALTNSVTVGVQADSGKSLLLISDSGASGSRVVVNGKNGKATLEVDEYGGRLDIRDSYNIGGHRKDGTPAAVVGINKNGNGVVQTWKRNGEPFHTLGNPVVLPHVGTTSDVIESSINGTFNGWDGETVVKLMNGQIWKQSVYLYEYHYAYMPDVLIYKSASGYKMLVDGTDEAVSVERIK